MAEQSRLDSGVEDRRICLGQHLGLFEVADVKNCSGEHWSQISAE